MKFDKTKFSRPDIVFSYWILLFVIFYFLGYTNYNPLFLLILGLIHNIFLFILLCYIAPFKYVVLFLIVNFFIKVLPIYLLRNTTITIKDIYFSFFLKQASVHSSYEKVVNIIIKELADNNYKMFILGLRLLRHHCSNLS